ncbi:MAG: HlyD family efflux transporter periplasmic adaptor subunit [Oscillospiraceae bacterium]
MDKAKKKQIKKITTWVLLAALVAGLTAMPLLAKAEAEADGPTATIHSGEVTTGSVSTTLRGGGTLKTEDVEDVILPTGVKITEFLVKNGDTVTAGTPLAAVDKVSVMTAITSVRETMDYLQEEIRNAKDEKISSTVAATAGGRIKKVYAQKGDRVQDVMLEHGALALLSLDGLMAVEIEKKMVLSTGETVNVTFADGTKVTGRVRSNLDGVITVTVEDNNYAIGETVTVVTKGGDEVGSGELYVHNAWAATAFSGIIKTVNAKEETKVTSGTTLFTLSDTDFRGTLEYVSGLHREYEDLMQDLFKMYNSGTIDAPCDGLISGIDKNSAHLLSADDGHWQITLLDHKPVQSFVGFAAKVTGKTAANLQLAVDPALIPLETLHNLCQIQTDAAAMTQRRGYPADSTIYVQNASGALVPGGSAEVGDTLLFVGDESGVLWVVNPAQSVKTIGYDHDGVKLSLLSGESGTPTVSALCDVSGEHCNEENTDPSVHYPECIKSCIHANGGCRESTRHYPDCLGACSSGKTCGATRYHTLECIKSCTSSKKANTCPGRLHHNNECIESCVVKNGDVKCSKGENPDYPHFLTCQSSCIESDGSKLCATAKGRHKPGCIGACSSADTEGTCTADPHHYPDCIELCVESQSGSQTCPASKHKPFCFFLGMDYKAKVALVKKVSVPDQKLLVMWDASNMQYDVEKIGASWKFSTDQGFSTDLLVIAGELPVSNPRAYKEGDVVFVVTGYQNEKPVWSGVPVFMNIGTSGKPDMDAIAKGLEGLMMLPDLAALMKGFNFSFYAPPVVEEDKLFDLEGSVLMTVSPEKEVALVITVDEQDIARVSEGQKALVKVQALGDQTFIAQVTEVSARGVNSGGSSKFAVKVEMEKGKNMLDGMSATASLPMLTRENVPTIPVMALAEQGARTVAYTALDEKTGEPANPVEVTVGLSDGKTAEILSGLEVGDSYYYSYYDVVEEDTGVEDRFTLR